MLYGESSVTEHAAAVGKGQMVKPLREEGDVGAETEEVAEMSGDSMAHFVEGLASEGRRGETEAASNGVKRHGVSKAKEGNAEPVLGWEGREGEVEGLEEGVEGGTGEVEGEREGGGGRGG